MRTVPLRRQMELVKKALEANNMVAYCVDTRAEVVPLVRSLLTAVGSDAFFSVTYPDPATGAARTMQCCCEERKTGILRMADGAPVWVDAGFTLIER